MSLNIERKDKQVIISMPKWLFWVIVVPWLAVGFLTAVHYLVEDSIKIVGWFSG